MSWQYLSLDALIRSGKVSLHRGNIISKRDIEANPGHYPIYSSATKNNGMFGKYGSYMFDEELITWSVDGGGHLFYRPKHKFSVTNVGGILRVLDDTYLNVKYLYLALDDLHSRVTFDWSRKAHPSVIRLVYDRIPIPPIDEQIRIVEALEQHLSRLDKALSEVAISMEREASFKRALLEKAFFGFTGAPPTTLGNHVQTRKTKGIPSTEPDAKYLGLEHVESHRGRILGFDSASKYRSASPIVEEGDVLYGRLRPYLNKVVIAPSRLYASGEFIVMLPKNTLDKNFLKFILMSPRFLAFTALLDTGDRPRVSWDKISNFQFPLPDLNVQKQIVKGVQSSFAVTDKMRSDLEGMKNQLDTLRRSLLHSAFSGKQGNG